MGKELHLLNGEISKFDASDGSSSVISLEIHDPMSNANGNSSSLISLETHDPMLSANGNSSSVISLESYDPMPKANGNSSPVISLKTHDPTSIANGEFSSAISLGTHELMPNAHGGTKISQNEAPKSASCDETLGGNKDQYWCHSVTEVVKTYKRRKLVNKRGAQGDLVVATVAAADALLFMKETEIPPNGSPCSLSMMDCSKDSSGPEFMSRSLDHPLATHLHDFENFKLVQNLKEYVAKRGIVLGPGWKAQISFCSRKGLHSYFSPSGKAFTSMKAAAKFLQEEREKELPMILASCSERFENISYRSASVCPHSIVLSKEIFLASSLRNQSLIKKVKFDPHASEPLALQSILPSGGNSFSGVGQHYDREAIDPVSEQLDEEGISYHQRPGKTRNYIALNDVLKEDNVDIAGRFPTKEGNHTEALRLEQCESIFHDVHISEQLTSLCDLFCGSFNDIKKGKLFGLNFIDLRMKSGLYAQSPEHFASDLRQICKHLLDIGQEMAVLAGDLLENFQTSHQKKQVNQQGTKETNSTLPRSTARKSSFHEFDLHPTPMELGACADGVCRLCGKNAEDDDCILICDGCEASYHMYCLSPALEEVPHGSWYCPACSAARKESSATNDTAENDEAAHSDIGDNGGMRHHCVVCERLYNLQLQKLKGENRMKRNSGNKSQWGKRSGGGMDPKDSDKMNNVSIIEEPKISIKKGSKESGSCKMCGSSKRGDKDMAKCANKGCFFKYYHILCLEPPLKSLPPPGWYCPSCLCRVCLIDENDDRIVLCDGCDEGYHTYCMNPSLLNIPKGKWYCSSCREKQIPNGLKIPRRVVP